MGQEALLLHQVIDGDPKAQRELYERYAGHAMSVCLRYIADRDAVMDVMQDAFVKVFTSIKMFHYRGEGSLKAWVLRIAANESLNYLRRNKRLTFSEELPELADEGDHPDVDGVPMEQLLQMIGSSGSAFTQTNYQRQMTVSNPMSITSTTYTIEGSE